MIAIENVLVSDELIEKQFVCDLHRCKGGCCEQGDAGAPLDESELDLVVDLYDKIKPYMSEAAIAEVDRKGKYVYHKEFGWVTPTLGNDKEICVYGKRDEKGVIQCAFEQAYDDGLINWKKPISCHLFPVIAQPGGEDGFDTMNYEPREKLCNPACGLGKKLQVPVYMFLRDAIVRKYGESFYDALDKTAEFRNSVKEEIANKVST